MNRFFVKPENITSTEIIIDDKNDYNHITASLRLSVDDLIEVSDTQSYEYLCKISEVGEQQIKCLIEEKKFFDKESPVKITLFQGLPKGSKMDLIIEKTVELGVYDIYPVETNRCVSKITSAKKEKKKLSRWNNKAYSAAKQSKRGIIPEVKKVLKFDQVLSTIDDYDDFYILYELENQKKFKSILSKSSGTKIGVFIGPEGGFELEEVKAVLKKGGTSISLGKRILRTETAGLAAISIINYELGDM